MNKMIHQKHKEYKKEELERLSEQRKRMDQKHHNKEYSHKLIDKEQEYLMNKWERREEKRMNWALSHCHCDWPAIEQTRVDHAALMNNKENNAEIKENEKSNKMREESMNTVEGKHHWARLYYWVKRINNKEKADLEVDKDTKWITNYRKNESQK
jgi:hypothetical protein